ncbi:MAG: hypothetical protein AAGD04_12070 [Pseudomonadota bacterium]
MTEEEYKQSVSALLEDFGMNYGACACPHEKGGFFSSPKVKALLILDPEHLDEIQRKVAVETIHATLTAAYRS